MPPQISSCVSDIILGKKEEKKNVGFQAKVVCVLKWRVEFVKREKKKNLAECQNWQPNYYKTLMNITNIRDNNH